MHEMGIALQVLAAAMASLPGGPDAAVRVERVHLQAGRLAAIEPASLQRCFDMVAEKTPLSGARLHITETPVIGKCARCRHESVQSAAVFSCAACGSCEIEIISGKELTVDAIELAVSP
ncbi:MAG: hydrogenase maturation nickel metallochaperone HypA [Desulfobacterales bacterium]|nr:hydrogenase maturation nickel metallochaperone HypA [Desulfobacterales bacterium]